MSNRWLAIALGLAAAAFLIYASFGRRWLFNTADTDKSKSVSKWTASACKALPSITWYAII